MAFVYDGRGTGHEFPTFVFHGRRTGGEIDYHHLKAIDEKGLEWQFTTEFGPDVKDNDDGTIDMAVRHVILCEACSSYVLDHMTFRCDFDRHLEAAEWRIDGMDVESVSYAEDLEYGWPQPYWISGVLVWR